MKYICRQPGPKSQDIIRRDLKVVSRSNGKEYSFVFKRARGCYMWDVDGRKYLDFAAGIAVSNVGHANTEVLKAVRKQLKYGMHAAAGDFYAEVPVKFCEELLSHLPKHLNNVFLSNSGTESVEAMYKAARWHTKKKWVIAFKNAFHGRTMGSLSMTNSKSVQRDRFQPFLPVKHAEFPYPYRFDGSAEECSKHCLVKLEKIMKSVNGNLAAVVMEPIQGEGGYIVPPKSFVKGVRALCDKYKALMCMDEVQAGCFRTGKFLASEHFSVKPDIVSLSKAIGGGVPLGATVTRKEIFDWPPGSHSNTFGGNLLACAAGMATLKFLKEKRLGDNATNIGAHMINRLNEMKNKYEIIGDIRGRGLMIGVEIVKDKKSKRYGGDLRHQLLCDCTGKGLIMLPCGKSVIRICPPLTLNLKQADWGLDIFEDAIKQLSIPSF